MSYLKYWDVNDLYGWTISQKLLAIDFRWVEDTSQFNKDFIKSYYDDSDEGYFLEVDFQYSEDLYNLHNDLNFLPERIGIEKMKKTSSKIT